MSRQIVSHRPAAALLLAALVAFVLLIGGATAQYETPPDLAQDDAQAPAGAPLSSDAPISTDNHTPATALSLTCGQFDVGYYGVSDTAPRWYRFSANIGWTLGAGILSAEQGWPLDTKLTLYKSDATTIVTSNDNADDRDPLLHLAVPETGTYYLKVEKVGSGDGAFTIWLDAPIYISTAGKGTVDWVDYTSGDILRYNACSDQWEMFIDMSDLDINVNTAGFAMINPNVSLISFSKAVTVDGSTVKPQDISLLGMIDYGSDTRGILIPAYYRGANIGLTRAGEAVDAIAILPGNTSFDLAISVAGKGSVPGVGSFADEDLIRFRPTGTLQNTAGTWSWYFDGSDVGLGSVDLWGAWLDPTVNELYLSFDLAIAGAGANAALGDISICNLGMTGPTTVCNLWYNPPGFGFDASVAGLTGKVDVVDFGR